MDNNLLLRQIKFLINMHETLCNLNRIKTYILCRITGLILRPYNSFQLYIEDIYVKYNCLGLKDRFSHLIVSINFRKKVCVRKVTCLN